MCYIYIYVCVCEEAIVISQDSDESDDKAQSDLYDGHGNPELQALLDAAMPAGRQQPAGSPETLNYGGIFIFFFIFYFFCFLFLFLCYFI